MKKIEGFIVAVSQKIRKGRRGKVILFGKGKNAKGELNLFEWGSLDVFDCENEAKEEIEKSKKKKPFSNADLIEILAIKMIISEGESDLKRFKDENCSSGFVVVVPTEGKHSAINIIAGPSNGSCESCIRNEDGICPFSVYGVCQLSCSNFRVFSNLEEAIKRIERINEILKTSPQVASLEVCRSNGKILTWSE